MSSKSTVLVVDDDDDIRDTLLEVLEENGYTVMSAANGKQALDLLNRTRPRPGLILLDLMMPVMDGRAFRDEQLRDPELAAIPVLLLSAYRDVVEHAKAMNVAGHLKKPPPLKDLLQMVEDCAVSPSPST